MKEHFGSKAFNVLNFLILSLIALVTLFPFYYIIVTSLATKDDFLRNPLMLFPEKVTFQAYRFILSNPLMIKSFMNSTFLAVVGTVYSMLLTVTCAYVLTRTNVKGIGFLFAFIIFTVFFGGGLIPHYLLIKNLGLIDHLLALILPAGINYFYMFLVLSSFRQVPDGLVDAAKIDGAAETSILFKIIIPLSLPILMTVMLFYAVDKWNEWYSAMLFLNRSDQFPLSYLLRTIIMDANPMATLGTGVGLDQLKKMKEVYPESVQKATIVFTILPIMMMYPFVQKYFVQGITIGAVKG